MKKRVIIRADGGTSIGLGHVVRCLALADMLKDNFDIVFAIQNPNPSVLKLINEITPNVIILNAFTHSVTDSNEFSKHLDSNDIVVLDGYNFKTDYQKTIKARGCKLVVVDDLHAWHHVADVIINHADGVSIKDYSVEEYTKLCLGLNFALLRKEFLKANNFNREIQTVKKVFISMGAADINNITQKFTEALLEIDGIEEIHLMLSSINPNLESLKLITESQKKCKIISHFNISAGELVELLKQCDICICPASSISLESCAVGIGLVSGYTAENQNSILNGLLKNDVCISLGDLNKIKLNEIKAKLQELIENKELPKLHIKNQSLMIDGKSGERLLEVFKKI